MAFKVIICGGRDFDDYGLLREKCDRILANRGDVEVVSGGARGADKLGEDYAKERKLDLVVFEANWGRYGKAAGFRRNKKMGDYADAVIAFPGGTGTQNMIDYAKSKGLPVRVVKA